MANEERFLTIPCYISRKELERSEGKLLLLFYGSDPFESVIMTVCMPLFAMMVNS